MDHRLLKPSEVARQLQVSRSTVYRWFWEGRLQGLKMGGCTVRIYRESLEEFLLAAADLATQEEFEGRPQFMCKERVQPCNSPLPALARLAQKT
jgi:excisionase family DNA binding protein